MTTATIVLRQFRQYFPDIQFPAALLAALDTLDQAQGIGTHLRADPQAIGAAVVDALAAGKDPATDKRVLAELARNALSEHRSALKGEIAARRDQVLAEHLPALLEALRPIVENADAAFVAARDVIPDLDLKDPTLHSRIGPDQARPLAEAVFAASQLGKVTKIWHLSAPILRLQMSPYGALLLADLTADEFEALPMHGEQRVDTDAALHAGHRLDMATPDTYRERIARVVEQLQRKREQAEEAAKRARLGNPTAGWTSPSAA